MPVKQDICAWMVAKIAERTGIPKSRIDVHSDFSTFGIDSLEAEGISLELEKWLKCRLPAALFWEHTNIDSVAAYLETYHPVEGAIQRTAP